MCSLDYIIFTHKSLFSNKKILALIAFKEIVSVISRDSPIPDSQQYF